MSEHTKEPKWHSQVPWGATKEHEGYRIHGPTNDCIARGVSLVDAKRILACVNACAGLRTEALEAGVLGDTLNLVRVFLSAPSGEIVEGGTSRKAFADYIAKLEDK